MTLDDNIRDKRLWYDINREAAKILELSSGKIDKYEYFTGEEVWFSDQSRMKEQAKFTYCSLGKTFEGTIEEQGEKQGKALEEHEKQLLKSNGEKDSLTLFK